MFNRIFWPVVIVLTALAIVTSPPVLSKLSPVVADTPAPAVQPSPTPTATATPDPFAAVPTVTPVGSGDVFIRTLPGVP